GILAAMKLEEIRIDYVIVDTLRVPRETFAAIIEAWRDGYADPVSEYTPISREQALGYFNQMIANIRDPLGFALWLVPVVSGRVPPGGRNGA
ncbi:MAG: class I SAM-dependent methyltransferase, partial [Candidatus Acidiferrales bacterium]